MTRLPVRRVARRWESWRLAHIVRVGLERQPETVTRLPEGRRRPLDHSHDLVRLLFVRLQHCSQDAHRLLAALTLGDQGADVLWQAAAAEAAAGLEERSDRRLDAVAVGRAGLR